jgi:hypothetical protein
MPDYLDGFKVCTARLPQSHFFSVRKKYTLGSLKFLWQIY